MTPMDTEEQTYCDILGISKNASLREIRKAYYQKALQYHPDRNSGEEATEKFQQLGRIYEILSDPEKRKIYDDTGSYDDDNFFSGKQDVDWEEYFRAMFKRVSEEDIDHFAKGYKHSTEEEEDVKKAYVKCKGDMEQVLDHIMLSTDDDFERFCEIIQQAIDSGELKQYKAFERSMDKFSKKSASRKKEKRKEEEEAEEIRTMILEKNKNKQAVVKTKQQRDFDALTASLEAKYATKGKQYKEPTEEEFEKARERLTNRSKETSTKRRKNA